MALKRADQIVVGDYLAGEDERNVVEVTANADGTVTIRFDNESVGQRYGPAYRFAVDDPSVNWQRIALRRLWSHSNATIRTACRNVITQVRTEAGL